MDPAGNTGVIRLCQRTKQEHGYQNVQIRYRGAATGKDSMGE